MMEKLLLSVLFLGAFTAAYVVDVANAPLGPLPVVAAPAQTHPTDPKDPVCYPRGTHPCQCKVICGEDENGGVTFAEDASCSNFCKLSKCACHPEPDRRDCQSH